MTRVAPRKHVTRTFDDYAEQYDAHLVGRLGYRVPQALRAALERVRGGRRFSTALDLGCGTGLLAERIADQVDHIVGVDLSPRMVARAEAKGLYARLHVGELLEFLEQAQPPRAGYDLIAAADVFVYVGDLAPIFAATHARLATEGLFAFSVEEAGGDGYTLGTSGRYAHSRAYLDGLASKCGLSVLLCESLVLRREGVEDVGGLLCVLAKSP